MSNRVIEKFKDMNRTNTVSLLQYFFEQTNQNQNLIKNYVKTLHKNNNIYKEFKNMGFINNEVEAANAVIGTNAVLSKHSSNINYRFPNMTTSVLLKILNRPINISSLSVIKIKNDGNCWYRAIHALLSGSNEYNSNGFMSVREISSEGLSEEYIKYYSMIGLIYYINDKVRIQRNITAQMRDIYGSGSSIYLYEGEKIYNLLTEKSKESIRSLNTRNIFDLEDIIWRIISKNEKDKISALIKGLVSRIRPSDSAPVSYLDPVKELPTLLERLSLLMRKNIILIDLHKNGNKYDSITLYTRPGGKYIDENTLYGFLTTEGPHTNVIYPSLYERENIPSPIMPLFDQIFGRL
jgi:hypothetical protein